MDAATRPLRVTTPSSSTYLESTHDSLMQFHSYFGHTFLKHIQSSVAGNPQLVSAFTLRYMPVTKTLQPGHQACSATLPRTAKAGLLAGQGAWSPASDPEGRKTVLSNASQPTPADVCHLCALIAGIHSCHKECKQEVLTYPRRRSTLRRAFSSRCRIRLAAAFASRLAAFTCAAIACSQLCCFQAPVEAISAWYYKPRKWKVCHHILDTRLGLHRKRGPDVHACHILIGHLFLIPQG
jgi:hypothetical protein